MLNSSFHARKKTRQHSQIVNKKADLSEIDYDDVRRWTAVRLAVPPYIPESRLDGCDMIDIEYELQVSLTVHCTIVQYNMINFVCYQCVLSAGMHRNGVPEPYFCRLLLSVLHIYSSIA